MADYLIICSDIFFSSKVGGTAELLGYDCQVVMGGEKAISVLTEITGIQGVIIDLTTPELPLSDLLSAIPEKILSCNTIAFGPHVEKEKLEEAESGGCAAVLTRSQFSAELPALLKQYW